MKQYVENTVQAWSVFNDEGGATLVEYGVALLVVIIVGAASINALGTAVGNEISETADAF